eukprot:6486196-Amphidinium_carterae.1
MALLRIQWTSCRYSRVLPLALNCKHSGLEGKEAPIIKRNFLDEDNSSLVPCGVSCQGVGSFEP